MAPERRFLPLLLFSLSVLFLYSYFHSSLHVSTSEASTSTSTFSFPRNLNPIANPNPNSFNFTVTIKVLTFDRLASLSRCLRSLANADYGGDKINLHVYIDHFSLTDLKDDASGAVLDKKLENSRRILDFVDGFSWKFGQKLVHYRTGNVGLQAQWLEAWWPGSDDEFAFVVEDDLEVSPLYYKFIRGLISNYYYNASNFSPSIYGASLQRPRFVPGKHGNKMHLDSEMRLFLYQLVGTWGQLLFPKPWKEFRLWYDIHKAKGIKPFLEGMVTTGWYKKMGERIWTPWFIKFIHSRGYFNIYTNFLQERALSVSHRDAGVNYGKTVGPDSHLLDESSLDFDLLEMQPLSNLKWYDFCFKEVHPESMIQQYDELRPMLSSLQKQENIILVSLFGASEAVIKNLLCHFERLNIHNYVLVGPKSNFILDLARRGHPVIDADQFLEGSGVYKLKDFQESRAELRKEIVVKAHVIKQCLESGYNLWVVEANVLLTGSNPFFHLLVPKYDFYVGVATGLFFVRSSSSTQKIWVNDFMEEVAAMANLLSDGDSLPREGRNFVYVVTKLLEQKGTRIKRVDETSFGVRIDAGRVNKTSLGDKEKMVFWSSEVGVNFIEKRLQELGMWIVDGESSCIAVVCHQS
ncbi:uncharacterized protein LOC131149665 [Malania oleifera]|uniref:uncharacterized protein LOC131149665 n=1 Tax=Malania oleifera TaxID=397392 RepID=UPI0025AE24E8|nr:uncharacterized protein LOC131149665 [Malania oleifera]